MPAFELIGWDGATLDDVDAYLTHLGRHLPDAYRAGRDFKHYVELLTKVHAGEMTAADASSAMPVLSRVGGVCPCSKSVRWVAANGSEGSADTSSDGSSTEGEPARPH